MISDAIVIATCDCCEAEHEVTLTALAQRESYDMRNVRPHLRRLGWKVDDEGDNALCPDCLQPF